MAMTSDGRWAVSTSHDKTLKVWDLVSGKLLRTLEGHTGWVNGVAVTQNGRWAVSASADKTLKVWDLGSGKLVRTLEGHTGEVKSAAVTSDGRWAVSASSDRTLKVWDLVSGKLLRTLEVHTEFVTGVAVTSDGRWAVSASSDRTLKVWDLVSGKLHRTLEVHTEFVTGVAVTSDGRWAVSASSDRTLKVWDLGREKLPRTLEGHTWGVTGVAVTSDGRWAVSWSYDTTLKVWDLVSGKLLRALEGHTHEVTGVAVTSDGRWAVSASSDRTLKVWDLVSGKLPRILKGHTDGVTGVAVTSDALLAVSVSRDETLKVWDLGSGKLVRTLEGHRVGVAGVAITADGRLAVSASSDKTLKVFDLGSGKLVGTLEGHVRSVTGVAATADGRWAVSASLDKTLKVWELGSGKLLRTLEGHTGWVNGVAVTQNGRWAVSTSDDKTLRVWDLATGLTVATLEVHAPLLCCAVASDHLILAGDDAGALHVLDWLSPPGTASAAPRAAPQRSSRPFRPHPSPEGVDGAHPAPHPPGGKLRPVEVVFVQDRARGRVLQLRDTEGIAPGDVRVPAELAAVLIRLDGARSAAQIAIEASRASGRPVDVSLVEQLVDELDGASMLDTPRFRARRREVVRAFAAARVRPAAHAGGAYHGEAGELSRYIEEECLGRARGSRATAGGTMVGLCATHMDLWRAAVGYGHAYRALLQGLDERVDTFVLLGTSHAAMRRPFAVCAKAFDTPLGALEPDEQAIHELSAASRFDLHEDEYLHKAEYSLEFHAVFLRHALGARAAAPRIVPVLCGLGAAQASRRDPSLDPEAESFVAALAALVERRAGRVLVVASADLAHVGPRFGDGRPLDEPGRERLRRRDEESIALALRRDAPGFFQQVAEDLGTRRVCGLGPIYTMLRVLPPGRGEQLHYDQHVDPDEGSIVSHASLGYYAG
jgi:AmmeMemoRadiSam system protein B